MYSGQLASPASNQDTPSSFGTPSAELMALQSTASTLTWAKIGQFFENPNFGPKSGPVLETTSPRWPHKILQKNYYLLK